MTSISATDFDYDKVLMLNIKYYGLIVLILKREQSLLTFLQITNVVVDWLFRKY